MKKALLIILPVTCFVLCTCDLMGSRQNKEDRISSSDIESRLSKSRILLADTIRTDTIVNTIQIEISSLKLSNSYKIHSTVFSPNTTL